MAETARKLPWVRIGAEGAAIVVSILLAFAIDAWYERRAERTLEAEYLQRIGDELRDARAVLEFILGEANRSQRFAPVLTEFFDGRLAAGDNGRIVVAVYNFGLDPVQAAFDFSTFEDLVSTGRLGLISNAEVRQAIQRAYADLQRLEPVRAPYRQMYLAELRGWIPISMIRQIRDDCPPDRPFSECSTPDFDEATVRLIVEQIDTREALLAVRLREQGLGTIVGVARTVRASLDHALEKL